jgi:hypothetical protein
MSGTHPVLELSELSRIFRPDAAKRKLGLLRSLAVKKRLPARHLLHLHDTLYFMRAYPDSPAVLAEVEKLITGLRELVDEYTGADPLHPALLNSGLPGSSNYYSFSYAVLERLVTLFPGEIEIDWEEFDDEFQLSNVLGLTVSPLETRGLEDESIALREWLAEAKLHPGQTRLHVFETIDMPFVLPLLQPGSSRAELVIPRDRIRFQKKAIPRERIPLAPRIRKPLDDRKKQSSARGRWMIDFSLKSLCTRNLEIYPLIYANPSDVTRVECGRGIEVTLIGMLPEFRSVPESLYCFMIFKNGVPMAYGPASVFMGRCEFGVNLFPEFRGGEVRYVYAQLMRVLHHLCRVHYFYIIPYGMGEDNPDALRSGAFWFYRKLGFRASNPEVEALARKEEAQMRLEPAYRSSPPTLRRLSHTHACFDLSGAACRRFDLPALGRAVTRLVRDRFQGDRDRAARACVKQLVRVLEIRDRASWTPPEKEALTQLAPLFCVIPDLEGWPRRDRRRLASVALARGRPDEFSYIRRLESFSRLESALLEVVGGT